MLKLNGLHARSKTELSNRNSTMIRKAFQMLEYKASKYYPKIKIKKPFIHINY